MTEVVKELHCTVADLIGENGRLRVALNVSKEKLYLLT